MKFYKKMIVTVAIFFAAAGANAGDVAAAETKSAMCAACHGTNGISATSTYPNLATQNEAYPAALMKVFLDGGHSSPLMQAAERSRQR